MGKYEIRRHPEIDGILDQLVDLARICFADYDGVINVDQKFLRWYLSRPGMDPQGCFAAVHRGTVVSNTFVTTEQVQLGGEVLRVGLVDTVMTHPDHRRRGLARDVLDAAIEYMHEREVDASQLYTAADSMPQRFYEGLGYREYVRVRYYALDPKQRLNLLALAQRQETKGKLGCGMEMRTAKKNDGKALRRFLDRSFAGYDGYIPLHDALWSWRRERRPNILPVQTYMVHDWEGRIQGTGTLATARLRKGGGSELMTGILDLAVSDRRRAGALFDRLISHASAEGMFIATSGAVNGGFNRICESRGFTCIALEVSMLRPFTEKGEAAAAGSPKRWYTATESLVGI